MRRIGLGLTACLVVLAGCARPEALSVAAPDPSSPAKLAPQIPLPLDISSYADAPCTLLKPGTPVAGDMATGVPDGATCTWKAKTPLQPQITVTVDLKSGGLEALYRKRARLPYFEPTDIAGYPAVHTDTDRSVPDQGQCTVNVGMNEVTMITVTSTIADQRSLNYQVPCPDTDVFATALVSEIAKN
jgi:uncharacterized protein DUF3558